MLAALVATLGLLLFSIGGIGILGGVILFTSAFLVSPLAKLLPYFKDAKILKTFMRFALAFALSILGIFVTVIGTPSGSSVENAPEPPIEQIERNEGTDAATENEPETETELETEKDTVISDLEIITAEDHPTYYGSTEQAHKVWKNINKEKIVFADSYDKYTENTIICMSGYRTGEKNQIIRNIEIYFKNFSSPIDLSLKDALNIAKTYLPFEIINSYYEFYKSYCIQPLDDDNKNTYYIVSYHLTESAKSAYYSNEHSYSGTIDVIICSNQNENVDYFTIGFGTPKWMGFLDRNGYQKTEWDYDFYKNE